MAQHHVAHVGADAAVGRNPTGVPSMRTLLNEATTWPAVVESVTPDPLVLRIVTLLSARLTLSPCRHLDALLGELGDHRVLDEHRVRLKNADAVDAGPRSDRARRAGAVDGIPRNRTERVGSFALTGMLTMTPVVPLERIRSERAGAVDRDRLRDVDRRRNRPDRGS